MYLKGIKACCVLAFATVLAIHQWCGPDRNLRDRDLVEISRRDRDFIKNLETETRDFKFKTVTETRNFKICAFCRIKKNVIITSDLNFFQISGIFPKCFDCFLVANTTNKKSLNYRSFNKPFLCNIQSLETWKLRDRDETWNLRDRESQKWVSRRVSRPRPCLASPHHYKVNTIFIYERKFKTLFQENLPESFSEKSCFNTINIDGGKITFWFC